MAGYGLRYCKVTRLNGTFTVNWFRSNRFHGGSPTTAAAAADDGDTISCSYAPS